VVSAGQREEYRCIRLVLSELRPNELSALTNAYCLTSSLHLMTRQTLQGYATRISSVICPRGGAGDSVGHHETVALHYAPLRDLMG
jgi:hypothetical protein